MRLRRRHEPAAPPAPDRTHLHLEAGARRAASPEYVEVDEVAAVTGLSTSTAGAALRSLRAKDLLVKVPYLAVDRRGRDIARPGYRLPGEA